MPDNRRSFIRKFGITLGSLIVSGSLPGCGPKRDGGLANAGGDIKEPSDPLPTLSAPEWEQLRQCWLGLDTLNEDMNAVSRAYFESRRTGKDIEDLLAGDNAVCEKRIAKHRTLLDAVVTTGELSEPVARHMQVAFEEAVYHIGRSRGTCYLFMPFAAAVSADLLRRAETLRSISGDLDAETVAKAQAAIAQDVACFEIAKTGTNDGTSPRDSYSAGSLKASPEALEAARLLTRLFRERAD